MRPADQRTFKAERKEEKVLLFSSFFPMQEISSFPSEKRPLPMLPYKCDDLKRLLVIPVAVSPAGGPFLSCTSREERAEGS